MTMRKNARQWLLKRFPEEKVNVYRVSKYYKEKDIWFFTFPRTYCGASNKGHVNILLQKKNDEHLFHYLKVPYSFFRENESKFDIRKTGEKFDLHISADKRKWLECQRSNDVSFSIFEQ